MKHRLCAAAALLAVFLLSGCFGGDDLEVDSRFVGTWNAAFNLNFEYVFGADGTGQRGDMETESFTWGVRDGLLVLVHGGQFRDSEIEFRFDNNMLTLTQLDDSQEFIRFEADPRLVGDWALFADDLMALTLNSDGTGFLSVPVEPEERVRLRWFAANDLMVWHVVDEGPLSQERFTFRAGGDSLFMESRMTRGFELDFVRGRFERPAALAGEWEWDENPEWAYFLGDDGWGARGFPGHEDEFAWVTFGDTLILTDGWAMEHLRFQIAGNALTLVGITGIFEGESFTYNRAP